MQITTYNSAAFLAVVPEPSTPPMYFAIIEDATGIVATAVMAAWSFRYKARSMTEMSDVSLRRFDANCRADFFALHSAANDAGWCYCAAWWVPSWHGWGERTAAQNRALREQLCVRGEYDG